MHGRVKTKSTAEQNEIKRQEREKKVAFYKNAIGLLLQKKSSNIYDEESFSLTTGLLLANPDIITLWNYRREAFLHMRDEDDLDSFQKLLEKDLSLTEQCLRVNPKSYGSWHHRVWILDHLPKPDWEKELYLCTKYLELDERNFHCWDFRRTITERAKVPNSSEYEYTLEKIQDNFSNYSAWHLRSKLLPKIYPDDDKKLPIAESKHKEELELVQNAAFTDPYDQSAWFYQRWLLGLTNPNAHFVAAQAEQDRIIVAVSKSIKQNNNEKIGPVINISVNQQHVYGKWTNRNSKLQSAVWMFEYENEVNVDDIILLKLLVHEEEIDSAELKGTGIMMRKPQFTPNLSQDLREVLENELTSCQQLLELEPDSKWALLTSIHLMQCIDSNRFADNIKDTLQKLFRVDPPRCGYYTDFSSKFNIEFTIDQQHLQNPDVNLAEMKIDLSNKNLTSLYHMQHLFMFESIDLSCNSLISESLSQLYCLHKCKVLNLAKNKITSLKFLPVLPKLKVLLLNDNSIQGKDIEHLVKFSYVEKMNLSNNPVSENSESWERVNQLFTESKLQNLVL